MEWKSEHRILRKGDRNCDQRPCLSLSSRDLGLQLGLANFKATRTPLGTSGHDVALPSAELQRPSPGEYPKDCAAAACSAQAVEVEVGGGSVRRLERA